MGPLFTRILKRPSQENTKFIDLINTGQRMKTQDWKPTKPAKALLIGHDPRLQKSDTQAPYALFADYYFNPLPTKTNEKRKYGLAKTTFDHISYLINSKIEPETIYVTNLCNDGLPHAPKGKSVLIPEEIAKEGIERIRGIIVENPTIKYIFPMSLQVNYWLQKLGFYVSNNGFVEKSEPKEIGLLNDPPYYLPKQDRTFTLICGNVFPINEGNQIVVPILHSKQFPLTDRTKAYNPAYEKIKAFFNNNTDTA